MPESNQKCYLRVGFPHPPSQEGGPGTFQSNLENFLKKKGCQIVYPWEDISPDIILVVAGTKRIIWLILNKLKGKRIIHRLDGINWKHKKMKVSSFFFLKSIIQNLLMNFIRSFLADHVVYQSKFVKEWWSNEFGDLSKPSSIIVNGSNFSLADTSKEFKGEKITVTCVEGTIQNDFVTISLIRSLEEQCKANPVIESIEIFGRYDLDVKEEFRDTKVCFKGIVPRVEMESKLLEKKRIFFLLELNPPCPNSMIEALCLGIPCLGFDSGSFDDLLSGAGLVIPFTGNVWDLELPETNQIKEKLNKIISDYDQFRKKAINVSKNYSLKTMCQSYLDLIYKLLNK